MIGMIMITPEGTVSLAAVNLPPATGLGCDAHISRHQRRSQTKDQIEQDLPPLSNLRSSKHFDLFTNQPPL